MIEIKKLADMLKDIKFSMMTTISPEGKMHSRPMATLDLGGPENFEGELWFFSKQNSYKVKDIEVENEVNLTYIDPVRRRYFSINGKASLEKSRLRMEELWSPSLLAWFPQGLEDKDLILIKVRVESAEVWDATPGKLVQEWPWHKGPFSEHSDYPTH